VTSGLSNLPPGVSHGDPYFYDDPGRIDCPGCEETIKIEAGAHPGECPYCGHPIPEYIEIDYEPEEPDWDSMAGGADDDDRR
jgi:hypothetical protein